MLTLNEHLKYDMTLQEYYITLDTVTNYTTYSVQDLAVLGNDVNRAIKIISHSVYRLIYGWRKGVGTQDHIAYMRKKIYDNTNGEVTALMLAMIEAVKGAVESGMDLTVYTDKAVEVMPSTVRDELRMGGLLDRAKKPTNTEAIAYTAGELSAT